MTVRRLCGYDLNGWSDRAARSWTLGADGDVVEEPHLTGRVLRSGVVRMATGKGMRWIGGAQASLAPHGRGGGWGEVGRPDRRRLTLDILRDAAADSAQLAAALSGLAERPGTSVLAIAEGPETSERLQERLVEAMGKARLGRGLLVWRSVLAVLAQDGLKDGMKVGVIGHVSAGFTLQSLRLRQVVTARGPVLAPERRRAADLVISGLGYDGLILAAERATRVPPDLREDWTVASRALAETALTGTAAPELYRNARGQFLHLTPPGHLPLPAAPPEGVMALADCDLILFETLTEGRLRQDLVTALAETLPCPLVACPPETVAQGALVAAKRLAQGLPVYFDFLPQISTIVLGAEGAQSYDLIEASATLPAGQIYRSAKPAHFAIQAGQASVSVHIRKELADWPRKARIELGAALPKATPVELRVEQAPASGRARLIVEAPSLARHFTLDWDAAEEIRRPWDALITELDAGEATIPARLVLPCGILAWEGSTGTDGLAAALEANRGLAAPDWVTLAERVKARPQKLHTISSDGDLPPEVPSHLVNLLGDLNARALEAVTAQARGAPTPNNAALIFLTWQFRNAPTELSHCLLEAMEARSKTSFRPELVQLDSGVPGLWPLLPQPGPGTKGHVSDPCKTCEGLGLSTGNGGPGIPFVAVGQRAPTSERQRGRADCRSRGDGIQGPTRRTLYQVQLCPPAVGRLAALAAETAQQPGPWGRQRGRPAEGRNRRDAWRSGTPGRAGPVVPTDGKALYRRVAEFDDGAGGPGQQPRHPADNL
ncbi:hypothetical protein NX862_14190 [Rhodobacter sp. KR11]|uniref:hypothetical protein n=1 Tax=Rhodobacter sp. KR11 TaxID=2974588 RepID=UPI0022237672|nr:hypothetical protein [Rhodobacter sp. KR11]MCW1919906.1 hypothetical protein [Rhodobacter sp. KR11]